MNQVKTNNTILFISLYSLLAMATSGLANDGVTQDIEMMIQTLTDKGDYVVLTKEEYEMMKIPVSINTKTYISRKN